MRTLCEGIFSATGKNYQELGPDARGGNKKAIDKDEGSDYARKHACACSNG